MKRIKYIFDIFLIIAFIATLAINIFKIFPQTLTDILGLTITALGTIPVILSTLEALKARKITVDLLATIALFLSIVNGELNSSIFINLMLTTARIVDSYTERKTEDSIKSLLKLRPKTAKIKVGTEIKEIEIDEIKKGDVVIVNLGERIPIDGIIITGNATIDQSTLTGESLPVEKKENDEVWSSTLIVSGNLEIKAERVGADTSLERIIRLVKESQNNKSEITTIADKFAQWYITIVLIASILLYLLTRNLDFVLSIILVVCADDIAIAIPLAFVGGIRSASRIGVIVKGGKYLETLSKVKILVVDKTGTLTLGKINVSASYFSNKIPEDRVLRILDSVMQSSNHPISKAINKFTNDKGYKEKRADQISEIKGQGIKAKLDGLTYFIGKADFIQNQNIKFSEEESSQILKFENDGYNATIISSEHEVLGIIALSDQIKPNIRETISALKNRGVERVIMLTGDNERIAKKVGQEAGITEFYANLLPEDKISYIQKFLKENKKLAMVGDGVNDAASLSLADIGISMGALGSDVAIDSSDIILVDDNLDKINQAIDLSKFILRISKENFISWGVVNSIGIILVFGSILNPAGAAFFNFITDFIPLGNAFRTFLYKPKSSK